MSARGIGVEEQDVTALAGFQRPGFLLDSESPGGHDGGGLKRLKRRKASVHVDLQLAMEGIARNSAVLDNPPATGEQAVVAEGRWKVMMATVRALHAAGIPIVAGTDHSISPNPAWNTCLPNCVHGAGISVPKERGYE